MNDKDKIVVDGMKFKAIEPEDDWKSYEGLGGLPGWYFGIVPPDLEEIPKDDDLFFCGIDQELRSYREIVEGIAEDCRPETLADINELLWLFEAERI